MSFYYWPISILSWFDPRDRKDYLKLETNGINKNEQWLGCTDIIESVIGKYKNFSAKNPMKEVGRAVLTMPVFTRQITLEEVRDAMENISSQDVDNWLSQNIGETLFSRRKKAYNFGVSKNGVKKFSKKYLNASSF